MAKVASVVYNRLDTGMALQFDSTLHYGAQHPRRRPAHRGAARTPTGPTTATPDPGCHRRRSTHPARTRSRPRCNPANTDYLYFVTVNLATGETKFAETLAGAQPERRGVPGVLRHLRRVLTAG